MTEFYFIYDTTNQLYLAVEGGWTDNPHEALEIPHYKLNDYPLLLRDQFTALPVAFWWNHTISHGTHRPCDLIPLFVSTLEIVSERGTKGLTNDWPELFTQNSKFIPNDWCEDDDDYWWWSEPAQEFLAYLFDQLNESCPPGINFGAHEGDGSDFGFWVHAPDPSENEEED